MKCPSCNGQGYTPPLILLAVYAVEDFPCSICKGSGTLPADIRYDPESGAAAKGERLKEGLSLRQYCKINGVDAVTRSEQERGFFRK
jgi:DnaJ-class molecular chaperone